MKAVRHQNSVWGSFGCSFGCSFGVFGGPVSADDLYSSMLFRMLFQPILQCLRAPVRQQLDRSMLFKVHQDSAVRLAPANSEVIHTKYSWSIPGRGRVGRMSNQAQQCGGADLHLQPLNQTTACFTSQGETYQAQDIAQTS